MALLLRKVKQHRWYKELAEPFLKVDDVPADPLADLQTSENLLSVWEVQEDRSNLIRIVRAVAIGGQRIDHTGYILFDSVHLDAAGIGLQKNEGRSDDKGANGWHRDLVLSGKKILALTRLLLQHGETGTITKPVLVEALEEGIRVGELPESCRKKRSGG
jgi:hypothetical protein